jgi:hypothetical protein
VPLVGTGGCKPSSLCPPVLFRNVFHPEKPHRLHQTSQSCGLHYNGKTDTRVCIHCLGPTLICRNP